jgi:hypothetical protein
MRGEAFLVWLPLTLGLIWRKRQIDLHPLPMQVQGMGRGQISRLFSA